MKIGAVEEMFVFRVLPRQTFLPQWGSHLFLVKKLNHINTDLFHSACIVAGNACLSLAFQQ